MSITTLEKEFLAVRSAIEAVDQKAESENRDVTDAEAAEVNTLVARASTIRESLTKAEADAKVLDDSAAILARMGVARPAPAAAQAAVADMSAGEFFSLFARAQQGDPSAELKVRAVADQLTSDVSGANNGILPTPIVGSLVNLLVDPSRPVFNSFTQRPMPQSGKQFTRPRITQTVQVAEQVTEKTQLASRKMTLTDDTVTKKTWGGVLDIAQQAIDWTDPSLLDIAISEFASVYAAVTEDAACDYLENLPVTTSAYVATTAETIATSYINAVVKVYTQSKKMANAAWLPLDDWATLAGQLGDNSDTPAISIVQQAISQVAPDFKFIVAPQLSTPVIGYTGLVEAYEQRKGILQAVNVPLFGLDIAYAGYTAFWGRPEGFTLLGATQGS